MVLLSVASVSLCVCVCVCPVRALTFESLALETSFLVWRYIFRILGQVCMSWSSGEGQGHRSKKMEYTSITKMHSWVVCLGLEGKLV